MTGRFPDATSLPAHQGLPDPFERLDGAAVERHDDWPAHREYLVGLLEHYLYGPMPPAPDTFAWETRAEDTALDGAARVEHATLTVERVGESATVRVGFLRPDRPGPFPVIVKNDAFLLGRQDPAGSEMETGTPKNADRVDQQAFAAEQAVERGYALCLFLREDVARDAPDRTECGVYPLYPEYREWGAIAAWAWAYRALVDALAERPSVDPAKVVATGHSRGGKAALCAGISEERIAVTVPNSSGTGGTGGWRHFDGDHEAQTLAYHADHHRHWWSPRLFDFADRECRLPFDAHTLKAAVAPRALLNTHARHDWWANPYGTALTAVGTQPVFDWLGVPDHNALHWRDGGHDQAEADWLALFDYCDRHFYGRPTDREFAVNPHPDRYALDDPGFDRPDAP